jgi:hypothetical protein
MTSASQSYNSPTQELFSWRARAQPGITASSAASDYDPVIERTRAELVAAIKYIAKTPITWSEREAAAVDSLSAETALAFVRQLPRDRAFPKIAPDGEGGIMLVWNSQQCKALITVSQSRLFLIANPGQPDSHHFQPLRFDGERIPAIVLAELPPR